MEIKIERIKTCLTAQKRKMCKSNKTWTFWLKKKNQNGNKSKMPVKIRAIPTHTLHPVIYTLCDKF